MHPVFIAPMTLSGAVFLCVLCVVRIRSFRSLIIRSLLVLLILMSGLGNLGQTRANPVCRSIINGDGSFSVDCSNPESVNTKGVTVDPLAAAALSKSQYFN